MRRQCEVSDDNLRSCIRLQQGLDVAVWLREWKYFQIIVCITFPCAKIEKLHQFPFITLILLRNLSRATQRCRHNNFRRQSWCELMMRRLRSRYRSREIWQLCAAMCVLWLMVRDTPAIYAIHTKDTTSVGVTARPRQRRICQMSLSICGGWHMSHVQTSHGSCVS